MQEVGIEAHITSLYYYKRNFCQYIILAREGGNTGVRR
jgi:hypothetical protein